MVKLHVLTGPRRDGEKAAHIPRHPDEPGTADQLRPRLPRPQAHPGVPGPLQRQGGSAPQSSATQRQALFLDKHFCIFHYILLYNVTDKHVHC